MIGSGCYNPPPKDHWLFSSPSAALAASRCVWLVGALHQRKKGGGWKEDKMSLESPLGSSSLQTWKVSSVGTSRSEFSDGARGTWPSSSTATQCCGDLRQSSAPCWPKPGSITVVPIISNRRIVHRNPIFFY